MKKAPLLLLLFCWTIFSTAQQLEHYEPLESKGLLPAQFTGISKTEYKKEKQQIRKQIKMPFIGNTKRGALRLSQYVNMRLLQSGLVLTGDTLSRYVNTVADEALRSDPELRKQLHFYVVESSGTNTFSTYNGSVYISIGFLARLHDESELAFAICREAVHYQKQHTLEGITYMLDTLAELEDLQTNPEQYARLSFSKTGEPEADSLGLLLFAKSNYDLQGAATYFNVLKYDQLPIDSTPFDKSVIESPHIHIDNSLFAVDPLSFPESACWSNVYSGTQLIGKIRLQKVLRWIAAQQRPAPVATALSTFHYQRDVARFELCRLYLAAREYPNAIYSAQVLLRNYPNNAYLRSIIAKALYNATVYEDLRLNLYETKSIAKTYEISTAGNANAVRQFCSGLPARHMAVIVLGYAWANRDADTATMNMIVVRLCRQLHKQFPGDLQDSSGFVTPDTRMMQALLRDPELAAVYERAGEKAEPLRPSSSNSFIVVDPFSMIFNTTTEKMKVYKSLRNELHIAQLFHNTSYTKSPKAILLEPYTMKSSDIRRFNEMSKAKAWLSEEEKHVSDDRLLMGGTDAAQYFDTTYHTQLITTVNMCALATRKPVGGNIGMSAVCLIFYPIAPVLWYFVWRPETNSIGTVAVYDLRQVKILGADTFDNFRKPMDHKGRSTLTISIRSVREVAATR